MTLGSRATGTVTGMGAPAPHGVGVLAVDDHSIFLDVARDAWTLTLPEGLSQAGFAPDSRHLVAQARQLGDALQRHDGVRRQQRRCVQRSPGGRHA